MALRTIILILTLCRILDSQEIPIKKNKYTLSVCALFRDEAKYLKEWIEYHRLIGVDHFYLYENNSKDRFRTVLNPYIRKGIVTLISWPDYYQDRSPENADRWALTTLITAYENAVHFQSKGETKWLALLDINEFLLPCSNMNIKEVLNQYENYPGVQLTISFYDASKNNHDTQNRLVIENLKLRKAPEKNVGRCVEKMIFKPEECSRVIWPPMKYEFKSGLEPAKISCYDIRVNQYVNRGFSIWNQKKHPALQELQGLTEPEIATILDQGYLVEDQDRKIYRFVPDLMQKMGYSAPAR